MANKNQKKVAKKQLLPKNSEADEPANHITDYAQLQNDELEALKAIYIDEFEEVEVKGAWSKSSDKAFRLHLKAPSDPEILVILSVRLTATYPKTAPILSVEKYNEVREASQRAITHVLENTVKELIGNVMIFEISSTIQDMLEDEAQRRANGEALPTLEEERVKHEADLALAAKEQELKDRLEVAREKEEEERHLQKMVEEEMARRKHQRRKSKVNILTPVPSTSEKSNRGILFDRVVQYQASSSEYSFTVVEGITRLSEGPVTHLFTVYPIVSESSVQYEPRSQISETVPKTEVDRKQQSRSQITDSMGNNAVSGVAPLLLVVKSCTLDAISTTDKKRILALEETLETLRNLPTQANCSQILDFKIDQSTSGWDVTILTEFANKGSLSDILSAFGLVPVEKARSWMVDLLEATEYLHKHGITHGMVHTRNVLFHQDNGSLTLKLSDAGYQRILHDLKQKSSVISARSVYWQPPELANNGKASRKTDIWDLGIVFLQMLFGPDTPETYNGPRALIDKQDLSSSLETMIQQLFTVDVKKRPSAFDLIPSDFLRNNIPISEEMDESNGPTTPYSQARRRRRSSVPAGQHSRYLEDWIETGRLGKGGFGEVVKARNKHDGRIYAIKKIMIMSKLQESLSKVLSEVMLLSRLNHPNVVRYYSAWPEEEYEEGESEDNQTSTISGNTSLLEKEFTFGHSTGGLDFISSSGYPKIVFGGDTDEEDSDGENAVEEKEHTDDEDDDETSEAETSTSKGQVLRAAVPFAKRTRTTSTMSGMIAIRTTLYIQMEYCERHTLRDLIRKGLYENDDEIWRLFRAIVDGLTHIHSHGIIHRDLKPDNVFIDVTNNPKIGDFGLATSGQYDSMSKNQSGNPADSEMTRSIGTTFYVAPELKSEVAGSYNDKVDMYSLGIIFFEMCYPLLTGMERAEVIGSLRKRNFSFPAILESPENATKCDIIKSLVSHRPSERPSSAELLRSGKIPFQIQDETIQQALRGLSDPSSPYYLKMMEALFSFTPTREIKDHAWDADIQSSASMTDPSIAIMQTLVKEKLCEIFRRHGAIEMQRQGVFPRSSYYTNEHVVELLNPSGTLVQLPYDLTLPNARAIARNTPPAERTYAFGQVYRDVRNGGAPRANGEVDFDIVSSASLDPALKEAEVLKVMDEIVHEIPSLRTAQMCFHLSHSIILDVIMEFCRISVSQRAAVKEVLSRLNIQDTSWQKLRNELRAPSFGIASTSLDDMAKFDFRDSLEKGIARIQAILGDNEYHDRLQPTYAHLQAVVRFLKQFGVRSKTYLCPLSCYNEKFYKGGVLFQCLFDTKRREVLAAGGRYDNLIEDHKPKGGHSQFTGCHAVGMSLGWDRLVSSMAKLHRGQSKSSSFLKKAAQISEEVRDQWPIRRCSVLVASFDSKTLRSAALRVLSELWANNISSELATDASSLEELTTRYRDEKHSWIVIIKNDLVFGKADLKVKSLLTKQDADVSMENLIPHLRAELRERDQREGTVDRARSHRPLNAISGNALDIAGASSDRQPNVQILLAQHKGKKTNRGSVIEAAQSRVQEHLASYGSGTAPIAAVETTDALLELLRTSRLSDPDSWKKVIQSAPANDRSYIHNIQSMLLDFRTEFLDNNGSRVAFIFNFRTGWIGMYDLSL